MTETVIVTGVSGFIGGNLARHLHEQGNPVLGVSRTVPTFADRVRHTTVDLTDFDALLALFRKEQPHTVYHLAASSVIQAASMEGGVHAMLDTNVRATANLLEVCRKVGVPVVVVASSDKQYGALADPPYDDADSTAFLNGGVYELSKAQQDQTARLFAGIYDVPAVRVARLANIYGAGDMNWSRIVPGNIRRAIRKEAPKITAGKAGQSLREYLYIGDAITALTAIAQDARIGGNAPHRREDGKLARIAVNIGSGQYFAAGDVIQTIRHVMNADFGIESPEPIVQAGQSGVFEPGSQFNRLEKLRGLIVDYAPVSLAEGLRKTIPWYLAHLGVG